MKKNFRFLSLVIITSVLISNSSVYAQENETTIHTTESEQISQSENLDDSLGNLEIVPMFHIKENLPLSYDDIFYNGGWERRENYKFVTIKYTNGLRIHKRKENVTTDSDRKNGLTRWRTIYTYETY